MRVLVICQYYYPEPFRISDICEELVKKGHYVKVVTGIPNYPMGEIYKGYENSSKHDEIVNGVFVHRCNIYPRKKGFINRFINYYSYSFKSSKYINKLNDNFDVVFINQLSPVMMAKAGIKYAKKNNKKTVLYCLDLWPVSLAAGGVEERSIIFKFFHWESKKIYKNVDKIISSSKMFSNYFFKEFGIRNIDYLPQYAEEIFGPIECKKKKNCFIDLMFAGNVGSLQNLEILVKVAKKCLDIKNLRWHVVGDGVELEKLKNISAGLPITYYGRKPLEEMPRYYSMADAMIVSMKKNLTLSLTLPGKIQTYMAAGKPIIASIDGEAKRVIKEANCGLVADAEDINGFEQVVRNFVYNRNNEWEENSYDYYKNHFSKQRFIKSLLCIFENQINK